MDSGVMMTTANKIKVVVACVILALFAMPQLFFQGVMTVAGVFGQAVSGVSWSCTGQQGNVLDIVREHPDNTFRTTNAIDLIRGNVSSPGIGIVALQNSTKGHAIKQRFMALCQSLGQGTYAMRCLMALPVDQGSTDFFGPNFTAARRAQYEDLLQEDRELTADAHRNLTLSLTEIRLVGKDDSIRVIACAANLKAAYRDGTASQDIRFTAQRIDDGSTQLRVRPW